MAAVEVASRKTSIWSQDPQGAITILHGAAAEAEIHTKTGMRSAATVGDFGEEVLRGRIASFAGRVSGVARVVLCNSTAEVTFQEGEVLVTEMVQPSMTSLVNLCSGVVCSEGGMLSHGAILCREKKKTCIVGALSATKRIQSGDRITLFDDGTVARRRRDSI